jgi:hypothetical protein
MLRLREQNATLRIDNKMKELKLLESQLGQREQAITAQESAAGMLPPEPMVGRDDSTPRINPMEVLAQSAAAIQQMQEPNMAPREVVRGADGRVMGVRLVKG